jgi:hypothetical protein
VSSDYSGQHKGSSFDSYSFFLTSFEDWFDWDKIRLQIRNRYSFFDRRMAYKNLNDIERIRVLPDFLSSIGQLIGLSVTFLVSKSIKSLFVKNGAFDMSVPELNKYSHWKSSSFEKAMRIITFLNILVAGLSSENQNLVWISDEDEIAANETRLGELTDLLSDVALNLLPHQMGDLRCSTTMYDDGSLQLEDIAAIPDLIAGALSAIMEAYSKSGINSTGHVIVPPPRNTPERTMSLMNWFSDSRESLKRLVLAIEPIFNSEEIMVKQIRFHGTTGIV